jgi:citrate lyase beta subunit
MPPRAASGHRVHSSGAGRDDPPAYRPDPDTLTWARDVLDAAVGERGVFAFRGRMIDEPVLRHARTLLARGM